VYAYPSVTVPFVMLSGWKVRVTEQELPVETVAQLSEVGAAVQSVGRADKPEVTEKFVAVAPSLVVKVETTGVVAPCSTATGLLGCEEPLTVLGAGPAGTVAVYVAVAEPVFDALWLFV